MCNDWMTVPKTAVCCVMVGAFALRTYSHEKFLRNLTVPSLKFPGMILLYIRNFQVLL